MYITPQPPWDRIVSACLPHRVFSGYVRNPSLITKVNSGKEQLDLYRCQCLPQTNTRAIPERL
jgi:hypothetical protein